MRLLLPVIALSLVLAVAAIADPDAVPETATPGASTTPSTKPPSSVPEDPKKAQSPPSIETKPKAKMTPAEIRQLRDTDFKRCMQDWDVNTHMTKKEWERTCQRVVDNRIKFMIEEMGR